MHLDDPRWRSSWRRKACLVVHTREDLAREAAAQFFKPPTFDAPFGSPWLDATLVACSDGEPPATTFPADPGAVLDLGGGEIKRSEARDDPMWAVLSSRMFQIAALMLLLSLSVILWMSNDHPVQIAQVREQARAVIAEHRSGPDRGFSSNPLLLFQASLAEAAPAEVTLRGKVYVPAYSTIRVTTGRARINLATTLSIHNTSSERPLTLERVDYHNTQGELVQAFLEQSVALKPLGVMEMFVPADDVRGGSGANFLIEWLADGPITEPIIEAVMIGVSGTTSYSFVSQGRRLEAAQ
jgi:hypothetical protein